MSKLVCRLTLKYNIQVDVVACPIDGKTQVRMSDVDTKFVSGVVGPLGDMGVRYYDHWIPEKQAELCRVWAHNWKQSVDWHTGPVSGAWYVNVEGIQKNIVERKKDKEVTKRNLPFVFLDTLGCLQVININDIVLAQVVDISPDTAV